MKIYQVIILIFKKRFFTQALHIQYNEFQYSFYCNPHITYAVNNLQSMILMLKLINLHSVIIITQSLGYTLNKVHIIVLSRLNTDTLYILEWVYCPKDHFCLSSWTLDTSSVSDVLFILSIVLECYDIYHLQIHLSHLAIYI